MRPGDLIEWASSLGFAVVGDELWSTLMQKWVPIGGTAMVISRVNDTYTWFSDNRLFHARIDDEHVRDEFGTVRKVVPRTRGR